MLVIFLFWLSLSILFYCYIGYGLLLVCFNLLRRITGRRSHRSQKAADPEMPSVTMIIPAYNEAAVLTRKLENSLAIDYPAGKLELIFITDGSTDGSEKLVNPQAGVILLHQSAREGKLAAMARAIRQVHTPVVVFSDANSMLNKECIRRIVTHYNDSLIGGVAGEKKIIATHDVSAIGEAEGLYWRYESFMKKQDAEFNTVVGAAGELFSMRTELFDPPAKHLILDDFILSMRICLKNYKIKYEPGAFATESPSASLREEAKRKIRIAAGAWQSIGYLKAALNFFKYPLLCFQYISRRLLRWVICPWMLLLLVAANIIIVADPVAPAFYTGFLYAQLLFYAAAIAGGLLLRLGRHIGVIAVPFYFLFMNYCLVRGLLRFLQKDQGVLWEKSARDVV